MTKTPELVMAFVRSDYTHCWYEPGAITTIDFIVPATGLTLYFHLDEAAVLARNPRAQRVAITDASAQIDAAATARFKRDVSEITAEKFDYARDVLPPVGWTTVAGVESFRISERIWGDFTDIYARLGDRTFTLADSIRTPAADIAARVAAFVAANPQLPKET